MKFSVVVVIFVAIQLTARAQPVANRSLTPDSAARKPLAVVASLFNHAVSMPFHKMVRTPVHPGFQAGVEGRYFENQSSKVFQTLNAGWFHNRYNGTGVYFNTEVAYRFTSKKGLFAEALAGLGYLRMFHPTEIYQLKNGAYEVVKDKGFSSGLVSGALGVGYAFPSSSALAVAPFVRYQLLVQTRYSPDLTALPQTALHLGVRINITRTR